MKAIYGLLISAIVPFSAQACPDLTGNYSCTAFGGLFRINVPVTQSTKGGKTTYVIDGAPIIADGNSHRAQKLPNIMARFVRDVTYTANCSGNAINFNGDGTIVKNGQPGTVDGKLTKTGNGTASIQMTMQSATSGTRNVSANCTSSGSDDFYFEYLEGLDYDEASYY